MSERHQAARRVEKWWRARWLALALAVVLTGSVVGAQAEGATAGSGLHAHIVLADGQVLAEQQADLLLEPASVLKLVVAAVALETLGPAFRAETRVSASAAPDAEGVIGDLIIHGAGDPTWNRRFFPPTPSPATSQAATAQPGSTVDSQPIHALVASLWARGVRRISGDLVLDVSAMPPPAQPRSRPLSELALGWAAPVSALAVDENAVRVRIAPGPRVGTPASATMLTSAPGAPSLELDAYTVSADRHDHGTVSLLPVFGRNVVRVDGEYPVSEPAYDVPVAMPDPVHAVASALRARCAELGIQIDGLDRVARVSQPSEVVLASVRSPPLSTWLPPVLELSHNWYAEMLLRQVALAHTGEGRLEDGLAAVASILTERVGVDARTFSLDDGSGLSADNLITVRTVAEVLAWAWKRPWRSHLVDALARPGHGTLRGWRGLPLLAAKTGSKQHVQALAGYLRPDGEQPRIFAVVLDHRTDPVASRREEIVRLLKRF